MYPHERSLVKKLEGKPFVLLGVNSDGDKNKLRKRMKEEQITWRSWWDGGDTNGPIANQFNVHGWPTLYLIDHAGTIVRRVGPQDDELIEQKVKEAEAAGKK